MSSLDAKTCLVSTAETTHYVAGQWSSCVVCFIVSILQIKSFVGTHHFWKVALLIFCKRPKENKVNANISPLKVLYIEPFYDVGKHKNDEL